MDEPSYVVVGRHEEGGLVYELVILKDEVEAMQGAALEVMWINNPSVRVVRSK
jgi:hypothetical protein